MGKINERQETNKIQEYPVLGSQVDVAFVRLRSRCRLVSCTSTNCSKVKVRHGGTVSMWSLFPTRAAGVPRTAIKSPFSIAIAYTCNRPPQMSDARQYIQKAEHVFTFGSSPAKRELVDLCAGRTRSASTALSMGHRGTCRQ